MLDTVSGGQPLLITVGAAPLPMDMLWGGVVTLKKHVFFARLFTQSGSFHDIMVIRKLPSCHVHQLGPGVEPESWWCDTAVVMFYCFWRTAVQSGSCPRVSFYKVTGHNYGPERGFEPSYSAVNTPAPFWWQDTAVGGPLVPVSCSSQLLKLVSFIFA